MFINIFDRFNFKQLNLIRIILLSLCATGSVLKAQQIVKGTVVENDSATTMPFVYIINKSNGNGTMSDNDGRFTLMVNPDDTLLCSYVGFLKLQIPVKNLKPDANGKVKIVMMSMPINLGGVTVSAFKLKPYEREYIDQIIDESKIQKLDYINSPISALYMRYSKEGKQITKLARIFEGLLIEEQVQKKLSKEILIRLTGDEKIDYYAFRKYCYMASDYFIVTHDGYELYSRVMECYKKWKAEGR
jgi:hypothetical protein